jgi:hypothetical protein
MIIIKYAIFLVQIGKLDLALTRLQVFHFDPRFMNIGQLLFFKGILELMLDNKSYMSNFIQSIGLTKTEDITDYEWLIDYFASRQMVYL